MAASVRSTYCTYKPWEKYSTVKEGKLGMTVETTGLKFVRIFFICVLIARFQMQLEETTS